MVTLFLCPMCVRVSYIHLSLDICHHPRTVAGPGHRPGGDIGQLMHYTGLGSLCTDSTDLIPGISMRESSQETPCNAPSHSTSDLECDLDREL